MSDGRCLLGTGRTDASADLAMLRVTSGANARLSGFPLSVFSASSDRRRRDASDCRLSQVSASQEFEAAFRNLIWDERKIEESLRTLYIAVKLKVKKVWKEKYCRSLGINLRNQG